MGPQQVIQVRMNLEVIAIKEFPSSPSTQGLEPDHQIQFRVIPRKIPVCVGLPLQWIQSADYQPRQQVAIISKNSNSDQWYRAIIILSTMFNPFSFIPLQLITL